MTLPAIAIAFSCMFLPSAAFVASSQLTVGVATEPHVNQSTTLATQASSEAKSAKKTTEKSAAYTIKKYRKYKMFTYATSERRYGKPVIKGSSKVVKRVNKSLNARYK